MLDCSCDAAFFLFGCYVPRMTQVFIFLIVLKMLFSLNYTRMLCLERILLGFSDNPAPNGIAFVCLMMGSLCSSGACESKLVCVCLFLVHLNTYLQVVAAPCVHF